jgi:hypothetical protein
MNIKTRLEKIFVIRPYFEQDQEKVLSKYDDNTYRIVFQEVKRPQGLRMIQQEKPW